MLGAESPRLLMPHANPRRTTGCQHRDRGDAIHISRPDQVHLGLDSAFLLLAGTMRHPPLLDHRGTLVPYIAYIIAANGRSGNRYRHVTRAFPVMPPVAGGD
jgi:hypothetical protein